MVIYHRDLCADCTGPFLGESVLAEITDLHQDHQPFSLSACFATAGRGLRVLQPLFMEIIRSSFSRAVCDFFQVSNGKGTES